jgi:hypothetical protein
MIKKTGLDIAKNIGDWALSEPTKKILKNRERSKRRQR